MIDFIDRVPTYKGKKIIAYEDGTQETVTITNADEATVDGTPINRLNMMAVQGFVSSNVEINGNNNLIETNDFGETLTTHIKSFADITQVFNGEKTITRTLKRTVNGWEVGIS